MRPFSVYRRLSGIFYAELFDEHGIRIASRSTGVRNRDEAIVIAHGWSQQGLPTKNGQAKALSEQATLSTFYRLARDLPIEPKEALKVVSILQGRGLISSTVVQVRNDDREYVYAFLSRYWGDNSAYIAERTAMGHRIGKRHVYEMQRRIELYWKPYFEGRFVDELRRADLKTFMLCLAERGLSAGSISKIIQAGTTIFRWAHATEILSTDPSEGLGKFSGPAKKRGVLTDEEISSIFSLEWNNERSKVGCIVALTCGLRAGEILGLRAQDISEQWLWIRHSWGELDGLKCPKTENERRVPLIPYVREKLLELLAENPHGQTKESFIFFDPKSNDRPMGHHILVEDLRMHWLVTLWEQDIIPLHARSADRLLFHGESVQSPFIVLGTYMQLGWRIL